MDQWASFLEQHWGLDVQNLEAVGPVFKVTTRQGTYCLKRGKHGRARLQFCHHALAALHRQGFCEFPRFLPTREGAPWAELDNEPWVVTLWIGRPLVASSQEEWIKAASLLGRFHQASHGLELPDDVKRVTFSGKWLPRFHERNDELRQTLASFHTDRNEFEALVLAQADELIELAHSSALQLQNSAYDQMVQDIRSTPTLVHGNVKGENFTVDATGRVFLIDFDSLRLDVWMQDVSDLFANALLAHGGSQPFAQDLFNAYHAQRPLQAEEVPILLALLRYPYRAVKVIHNYQFEGRPLEKTLRKWKQALFIQNLHKDFVKQWATWLEKRVQ